jgi:hypothetical protein
MRSPRGTNAARGRYRLLYVSLVVSSCALLSCSLKPETIWSTTEPSPDGLWVAGARTQMWSGPGIGTVESSAYLVRANDSHDPRDVISYPEGQGDPHPQIKWRSAKELVVIVPAHTTLDLQVIKFADIQISLEYLPSGASTSNGANR